MHIYMMKCEICFTTEINKISVCPCCRYRQVQQKKNLCFFWGQNAHGNTDSPAYIFRSALLSIRYQVSSSVAWEVEQLADMSTALSKSVSYPHVFAHKRISLPSLSWIYCTGTNYRTTETPSGPTPLYSPENFIYHGIRWASRTCTGYSYVRSNREYTRYGFQGAGGRTGYPDGQPG